MTKSATDVMQEIIVSAVLDSLLAMKAASKGLPNTLLRDMAAVHANTTFTDLPAEVQSAVATSVRAAFTRLLKEGYSVSSGAPAPARPMAPRGDGPRPQRSAPPRRHDEGPRRPPRDGPRPGRPSGPRGNPSGPRGK